MSAWSPLPASGNNMYKKKMQQTHEYLKVSDSAEDILLSLEKRRFEGSCRWLTQREQFREFWLRGKPATRESVMASHVITYLNDSPCC